MNWFERNSKGLQAIAAIITAAAAIIALIGVKLQVDASYRVQREQSAKEIYRELLNLSIANPDFVAPNYCTLKQSPKFPAYESYVDYVLYTGRAGDRHGCFVVGHHRSASCRARRLCLFK